MKKSISSGWFGCLLAGAMVLLLSCNNPHTALISKKWDCVAVDNLEEKENHFLSKEDSVTALSIRQSLQSLSWTFTKNNSYECRVGGRLAVAGTYQLLDNGKTLICRPASGNTINAYRVNTLTETEMVLTGNAAEKNIVMHFKAD
ncbi:MAG: hypothetical protein U0X40_09190 [Ferruginibacter sp.]